MPAKNIELPNTLGELLAVALQDARKAAERDDIILDMNTWVEYEYETRVSGDGGEDEDVLMCHVCLAGAVMLRGAPEYTASHGDWESYAPADWPKETSDKLEAIDLLRNGNVCRALIRMSDYTPDTQQLAERATRVENALPARTYFTPSSMQGASDAWWTHVETIRDALLKEGI